MDNSAAENLDPDSQSSFGIKKIVDCKIDEGGRQMFKVKWEPTWEPAENLASCQHLIDKFWTFVNKAKTNEEAAEQVRKKRKLDTSYINGNEIEASFDRISEDNKAEIQRLIARTNATSAESLLLSPSNMFAAGQLGHNNLMPMTGTPPRTNNHNSLDSPVTPQNMRQHNHGILTHGQKALEFSSSQQSMSPGQKGKFGLLGNKVKAKTELDESKFSPNDLKSVDGSGSKSISNSGLKYLENFENPYVKITLVCKVCSKEQSLKYPNTWKRHFLTHANKEDLPHKCNFCGKAFVTSTNLKNHMKTHVKGSNNQVIKDETWFVNSMDH